MRKIFTLSFAFVLFVRAYGQTSETHNFITYDTTYNGVFGSWQIRITRPANMFTPGSPDTASRPAIITQNGIGECGNTNPTNMTKYGPHYWLTNGWDGSVVLGNGIHYPILITVSYINNTWPAAECGADVLAFLLSHYHIKKNSVHLGGLSLGSFVWTSMIAYEVSAGAETGMSMVTSLTALEGFSLLEDYPFSSWSRGDAAYGVWAQKYHGKYFGLEGTNDLRNVATGEKDMNSVVPGSAHFSYENLGGGAHCCWNSMYDPSANNWQSFAPMGPNVTGGADTNSRGTYHIGSSIFQWMLRQGDTSMVGSPVAPTPVANAGTNQTVALPTNSVALSGSGSETGGTITGYAWKWVSGPAQYSFNNANIANPIVNNLTVGTYVFQLAVTDSKGAVATGNVSVTVNAAAGTPSNLSGAVALPGTVQAENYSTMSGVETQATTDAGGGSNVGWIDAGDWMDYPVNVQTAGTYTVSFRVATINSGAAFQLDNGGSTVYAKLSVPYTAGYQTWTTITATVTLAAGTQTLRILSTGTPEWNFNWLSFALNAAGNQQPIPGIIQAESYTSMSGVQTQGTTDVGGGHNVGWIDNGDWMDYAVNVQAAGTYTVSFRVATATSGAAFQLDNGASTVYAKVALPNTGGTQTWQTVSTTVNLPAGVQTLRLLSTGTPNWNINWFSCLTAGSALQTIPGVVQAESYTSMSGVETQLTTDAGGGHNVGWIDEGDWMDYAVNVQTAGTYTVSFRVATSASGGAFQLDNGASTVYAKVTVPNTGGFQTWSTVSATVTLPAGLQMLRLLSTATPEWNINWISFAAGGTGGTATNPATVSTEAVSAFIEDSTATQTGILLYPNPTTDAFQLVVNNAQSGKMQVQVISPAGRVLKVYTFEKGLPTLQVQVSLAGLPAGVYLIRFGGVDWQEIRKVIKQ